MKIKDGQLTSDKGNLTGSFTFDMVTIADEDISNPEYKGKLEGHLKSGAAGIFIILFAVIQSALLLRIRSSPNENDRTVEVSIGPDIKIVLTGVRSMRETVDKLTPIIREISSRQAEGTPGTVSASMHDSASGLNHPRSGVHSLHKP